LPKSTHRKCLTSNIQKGAISTFFCVASYPHSFVWPEVYKNDDTLLANLTNPAVDVYLEAHAEIETNLSFEFYGTILVKVTDTKNLTGVPYRVFKTKLRHRRV